ncbi:hypothetical protein BJV77DRAFT_770288 [Russula vinacea]|nr:hypothetical protein BJV77DRAFT_770288 [Russula vinacea]
MRVLCGVQRTAFSRSPSSHRTLRITHLIPSMSQTAHRTIEVENNPDGHPDPDHPQSTPNPPSQGESNSGDSSGPFFSIYSKTAKEEDDKMVDRWQKDADGILIFTGLFSAAVAALLALTVPDLRPNSQDTSAFYLANIYGVLADPNATRASIPPPASPPPFSPPRYTVWVNTLWFLSLVMSLSCALWATSLHNGRVDISVTLNRHSAVQRSGRGCVHTFQTAWTKCVSRWRLKDCRRCYISLCSCFLLD